MTRGKAKESVRGISAVRAPQPHCALLGLTAPINSSHYSEKYIINQYQEINHQNRCILQSRENASPFKVFLLSCEFNLI